MKKLFIIMALLIAGCASPSKQYAVTPFKIAYDGCDSLANCETAPTTHAWDKCMNRCMEEKGYGTDYRKLNPRR